MNNMNVRFNVRCKMYSYDNKIHLLLFVLFGEGKKPNKHGSEHTLVTCQLAGAVGGVRVGRGVFFYELWKPFGHLQNEQGLSNPSWRQWGFSLVGSALDESRLQRPQSWMVVVVRGGWGCLGQQSTAVSQSQKKRTETLQNGFHRIRKTTLPGLDRLLWDRFERGMKKMSHETVQNKVSASCSELLRREIKTSCFKKKYVPVHGGIIRRGNMELTKR